MRRREFLKRSALGCTVAGGLVAGCSPRGEAESPGTGTKGAPTGPKVTWRLASSFPRSLDTIYGAAETLAKRVEALTNGGFKIRAYPSGELVDGLAVLDAVQKGSVPIGHSASYYFVGKNPALAFDTAVPFGLNTRQQSAWLSEGGGLELMRDLFADFNIINFPGGNTGVQMGGWWKEEFGSLAELRGRAMRIPGLGGVVMGRLGVSVQVIAGGDIFPALERGAIDGAEWVGPYDDQKLGFHRAAKYYYYPGWWEPGPSLSFYVNRDAHAKLPENYRAALEVATAEAAHIMQMEYDAKNPLALQQLIAEGVQLRPFPGDVMLAAREAMEEYVAEQTAKDATYRKIHTHWKKFKDASDRWLGTAEHAYASFIHGV